VTSAPEAGAGTRIGDDSAGYPQIWHLYASDAFTRATLADIDVASTPPSAPATVPAASATMPPFAPHERPRR